MATKIKDRLKDQPPFVNEEGKPVAEKPKEEPVVEEAEIVEEPKEEPKAEPKVEGADDKAEPTEEPKERTKKQFEKLTQSNKNLKKENDKIKDEARKMAKEGLVSTLVQEQPKAPAYDWDKMVTNKVPPAQLYSNLTQKDVKTTMDELVDDQGYVNTDLLKETLNNANRQVQTARVETAQLRQQVNNKLRSIDDFQRTEVARRVHRKFPQLDPDSDKFIPEYYEDTRDKMISNLAKGLPEDFMGSAEKFSKRYITKEEPKEEEPKVKKSQKEQQAAISQINATGTKVKSSQRPYGKHAELVKAVQQGKKGALAERLKRSGF